MIESTSNSYLDLEDDDAESRMQNMFENQDVKITTKKDRQLKIRSFDSVCTDDSVQSVSNYHEMNLNRNQSDGNYDGDDGDDDADDDGVFNTIRCVKVDPLLGREKLPQLKLPISNHDEEQAFTCKGKTGVRIY